MTLFLLPTDALFLASLVGTGWALRVACRQTLFRARWLQILGRPAGGVSCLLLVCYLSLAVLDSVRFQSPTQAPLTGLDLLLTPLREAGETTYSAPFASYGHVREAFIDARGQLVHDYPRLRHGGRHLANPDQDAGWDIALRALRGGALGLGSFLLGGLCFHFARRRPWCDFAGQWRAPGSRWIWAASAMLCTGVGMLCSLAPVWHVLGTDKVGTDVLYVTLKSVRTGLVLGVLASVVTLPVAVLLGMIAGYFRGWVDDAIQYVYTVLSSIPGVLLIAAAVLSLELLWTRTDVGSRSLALRADLRLLALCGVLGLTGWMSLCRLLRGEVMRLRTIEFVLAARALGSGAGGVILRHLLPNVMPIVIITTVLDFSSLVMAEAVLTYIDIGVDPSMESWGNMINGARLELARDPAVWWCLLSALGGMFGLVLAANLLADTVRDVFDPHAEPGMIDVHGLA